jgi:ABC-type phosphate/phosphonate transport system ATPase subunit
MLNLFSRETEEAAVKLINSQGELIALLKESTAGKDEIIASLKRLVEIQELQITELKSDLKNMRDVLFEKCEQVSDLKDKLSKYENKQ